MEEEEQPLFEEFRSAIKEKTLRVIKKARLLLDENTVLSYRVEMLKMENERLNRELESERRRREPSVTRELPPGRGST